jgi:hypothetical protein
MFRWLSGLRVFVRSAVFRKRVGQDLDEEMQYHLEQEINERLKGHPLNALKINSLSLVPTY